jgi:hypothetical protein
MRVYRYMTNYQERRRTRRHIGAKFILARFELDLAPSLGTILFSLSSSTKKYSKLIMILFL